MTGAGDSDRGGLGEPCGGDAGAHLADACPRVRDGAAQRSEHGHAERAAELAGRPGSLTSRPGGEHEEDDRDQSGCDRGEDAVPHGVLVLRARADRRADHLHAVHRDRGAGVDGLPLVHDGAVLGPHRDALGPLRGLEAAAGRDQLAVQPSLRSHGRLCDLMPPRCDERAGIGVGEPPRPWGACVGDADDGDAGARVDSDRRMGQELSCGDAGHMRPAERRAGHRGRQRDGRLRRQRRGPEPDLRCGGVDGSLGRRDRGCRDAGDDRDDGCDPEPAPGGRHLRHECCSLI